MFQIKPGAYNTGTLIAFLEDLHEYFACAGVTLIWDNLPSHKSRAMTAWIATQQDWLKSLLQAQADFTRELADSYTSTARSLLT